MRYLPFRWQLDFERSGKAQTYRITILLLVLQKLLVTVLPFWTIAHHPDEPKFFKLPLSLRVKNRWLSLHHQLVLTSLVDYPVTQTRKFTQARDQAVPVLLLKLLKNKIQLCTILKLTNKQKHVLTCSLSK